MAFYLLAVVVALTTIFGLVHSQAAREKLHLQPLYAWSVSTVEEQLHKYNLTSISDESDEDEFFEIPEISVDRVEVPQVTLEENPRPSESIEEIQGIRLTGETSNISVPISEEVVFSGSTSRAAEDQQEEQQEVNAGQSNSAELEREQVLDAIKVSLSKLSAAARSGRINGTQLYEILLQETLRQQTPSAPQPNNQESEQRARLYFGEPNLEYVPHSDK